MKPGTRRALRAVGLVAFLAALWLAWDTIFLYPLKLLVVLLHEVSHGLAAVATGGRIKEIAVTANQGGWCDCPGGNAFLTLSAGYLGSLGWGALLVWAATRSGRWERATLVGLGVLLLGLTVGWVERPLAVALGLGAGLGLLWAAVRARGRVRTWLLALVGTTSCLYALLDVKSDVLDRPGAPSDAVALAELTGVPALVWGVVWMLASAAVLVALWRRCGRGCEPGLPCGASRADGGEMRRRRAHGRARKFGASTPTRASDDRREASVRDEARRAACPAWRSRRGHPPDRNHHPYR